MAFPLSQVCWPAVHVADAIARFQGANGSQMPVAWQEVDRIVHATSSVFPNNIDDLPVLPSDDPEVVRRALDAIVGSLRSANLLPAFHPLSLGTMTVHAGLAGEVVSLEAVSPYQVRRFGFKATRLAEVMRLGLPVPKGVVVTTDCVDRLLADGERDPLLLDALVWQLLRQLREIGLDLTAEHPPLVAVRSGAPTIMEGIIPTLQYVGLNDQTAAGLVAQYGEEQVERIYLRFITQFAEEIAGVAPADFAKVLEALEGATMWERVAHAKRLYRVYADADFPEGVVEQLRMVVGAIARSWNAAGVVQHRRLNGIEDHPPTALIVQEQKFGGLGKDSASGVLFTRNPKSGAAGDWGSAKLHAGGDEVMTGSDRRALPLRRLFFYMEAARDSLRGMTHRLESHFHGPQKLEFVVQDGESWVTQVDPMVLWPMARVQVAVAMNREGIMTDAASVRLVNDGVWWALASPRYRRHPGMMSGYLLSGKSLVPGIAKGNITFDYEGRMLQPCADRSLVIVLDYVAPAHWDWVLKHAVAIVFVASPPAHFIPRALAARVPVILSPGFSEGAKQTLEEGAKVWLDATHEDGWLSDQATTEKLGERARFLRNELTLADIQGENARTEVATILAFREIQARYERSRTTASPKEVGPVVESFLREAQWSKPLLEDAIFDHGWGRLLSKPSSLGRHDGYAPTKEDFVYEMNVERVRDFVTALWQQDPGSPKRLALAFVDTEQHEHAFMKHLFRLLDDSFKGAFLNEYVRAAQSLNRAPGRPSGIYLLSRLVSQFFDVPTMSLAPLGELTDESVEFLSRELDDFYQVLEGRSEAGPRYARLYNRLEVQGIALRNPALHDKAKLMNYFLRRSSNEG